MSGVRVPSRLTEYAGGYSRVCVRGLVPPPPPLAQARPRSQQSGQNGGSTPTPCLDKAVHARDTCDSQTGNNIVSHG